MLVLVRMPVPVPVLPACRAEGAPAGVAAAGTRCMQQSASCYSVPGGACCNHELSNACQCQRGSAAVKGCRRPGGAMFIATPAPDMG